MRVIFLNAWHAKIKEKLFNFIGKQASKTDIFCLQELDREFFDELGRKLNDFNGIYLKEKYIYDWDFHQSLYVNKKFDFKEVPGGCQAIVVRDSKDFLVCNIHGVSLPGDKNDSDERLKQSKLIIDFAKKISLPAIIGGDFNLNPDTKSIKMFETAGYRDLIKEYKIKATRNHFAWEQAERHLKEKGWEFFGEQPFADYVFTSPEVKVKDFEVPYMEISDHLPLILEFEI